MYLIEEKGEVALYHDGYWVYVKYQDKTIKLNIQWNFNAGETDRGWRAVSADFLNSQYMSADYPWDDILLLWENGKEEWQALTFSITTGELTGLVGVAHDFYSIQELQDLYSSSTASWYGPVADQTYFSKEDFILAICSFLMIVEFHTF